MMMRRKMKIGLQRNRQKKDNATTMIDRLKEKMKALRKHSTADDENEEEEEE